MKTALRVIGTMSEEKYKRRGVPLVVSAPSGGGKTTLCHKLIAALDDVAFSVSYTTRPQRGQEQHGVDYYFVSDEEFDDLVNDSALLEWAHVHGHRYGTHRARTEELLAAGKDVLFDIDIQGGEQIAESLSDAVLLFILPPNKATLEERLRGRLSDSEEQILRRLKAAESEIDDADFYHYWIINKELEPALEEMKGLLLTERLKRLDKASLRNNFLQPGE